MAQARVTEFFVAKKKGSDSQASKRRKLNVDQINVQPTELSQEKNTRTTRLHQQGKQTIQPLISLDTRPENLTNCDDFASSKSQPAMKTTRKTTKKGRRKPITLNKDQLSLDKYNFISTSDNNKGEVTEETTSSLDDHDGLPPSCPVTPTKDFFTKVESAGVTRKRTLRGKIKPVEDASPAKAQCKQSDSHLDIVQNANEAIGIEVGQNDIKWKTKAKRRLALKTQEKMCSVIYQVETGGVNSSDLQLDLPLTPPPVSPLPDTPEEVRKLLVKGPEIPTSPNVKKAIEQCKMLMDQKSSKSKSITPNSVKAKLSKCGKLEELKSQLAEIGELSSKLKTVPKIKKFDEIKVEVEIQPKSENVKAPAYARFDTLASPAAPTLSLPYMYRVLVEMFRGMETVVSMIHNRQEICTFSKLKAAVQEITKRNFEEKTAGQVKTVYPTAYNFRQEKGLPMFGGRTSDYQLTIEANLGEQTMDVQLERIIFAASHILKRRNIFQTNLIDIVKKHHKVFLSKLDRPLNVPDHKITRWHPRFRLDEVPDIESTALPQPPFVKKYQTAKDVLEQTRGRILPRVEKALESVALESQAKNLSSVPSKTVINKVTAYKGIPAFLLEKIRNKEAQKLEAAMTKDPKESRKTTMMRRLPEIIRILRSYFITEKKPALVFESVAQKLVDSYKSCISISDMEEHIKLMLELIPEWLTLVEIKRGKYLKIDRSLHLEAVTDKINNILKGR